MRVRDVGEVWAENSVTLCQYELQEFFKCTGRQKKTIVVTTERPKGSNFYELRGASGNDKYTQRLEWRNPDEKEWFVLPFVVDSARQDLGVKRLTPRSRRYFWLEIG